MSNLLVINVSLEKELWLQITPTVLLDFFQVDWFLETGETPLELCFGNVECACHKESKQ